VAIPGGTARGRIAAAYGEHHFGGHRRMEHGVQDFLIVPHGAAACAAALEMAVAVHRTTRAVLEPRIR
jgi:enolase